MTEPDFRARLAALGLTLDATAFAAAWAGAQHLRGEIAKVATYLAQTPAPSSSTDPANHD